MDRFAALALFVLALGCGCAAVLLLLMGFIDYLQTGRWTMLSVLQLGYDSRLIDGRWFLANPWTQALHESLRRTPVAVVALAAAPLCWWLSGVLGRR